MNLIEMAAQIEEKQASIMQVKKTLRGARKEMEQLAESCKIHLLH